MRQSGVETLITEEPDDRIGHVRICGGDGQQWLSLPGKPTRQLLRYVGPLRCSNTVHPCTYAVV
jgi:hypothetical protein